MAYDIQPSYLQGLINTIGEGEDEKETQKAKRELEQKVSDIAYQRVLKLYKDDDMALEVSERIVKRIISRCKSKRSKVDLTSGYSKDPDINFKAWVNEK